MSARHVQLNVHIWWFTCMLSSHFSTFLVLHMQLNQSFTLLLQGYHRDLLEHWSLPVPPDGVHPPPPVTVMDESPNKIYPGLSAGSDLSSNPMKKAPTRRGKDRRSKRHRKVITGSKDVNTK
ncbi:UNVERIFIED_CONTAM: hypothetical protein Sradi_2202000 [Sesamum radiatum]|uniref:Uncharacterized protein n=1 Tax=Sesamum radiatum TaxID=300843 RepID=A0AAW2T2K8_SESRA